MGIPETIVAAGIGGAATVTAALFQLYTALRVKTKADARPKKSSLLRSSLAIAALMVASAVGGYACSEYLHQQTLEDTRAMRDEMRGMREELNAKLQALAQTAEHLAHERGGSAEPAADTETMVLARGPVDRACADPAGDQAAAGADAQAPATQGPPTLAPVQLGGL